jgi:hypothetical protein
MSRGQRGGSPTVVNLSFLDWATKLKVKYIQNKEGSLLGIYAMWPL